MEFLLLIALLAISGIYDNYETVAGDTILLDEYPADITLGEDHKAYVLTLSDETFSVVVIEHNEIIEKMQFNQDYGQPTDIEVDTDNEILYVANYSPPSLSAYDLETKKLIQNVSLDSCPNSSVSKFYLNQKTNSLYFLIHGIQNDDECNNGYSGIKILDGITFEIIPNLTNSFNIHSLLFNSEKNSIFALYNFGSNIDVIDDQNNLIINSINLIEKIDYINTYDKKSDKIFGYDNGTLTIVDANDSKIVNKIQIPNHDKQQIRLISGNDKLFIIYDGYYTNQFSGKNGFLIIFDIEEETFSKKIPIGQRPLYFAFDNKVDLLYTVNSQSDSISIIDVTNVHVINSVESFRFEIVSIIVLFVTIFMLIIIIKNKSTNNRSWLIGGLLSVFGIFIPWSYQFFLRLGSGSIAVFDVVRIPIWPIAVALPVAFSILYYIFLFTRFKKIRNFVEEVYYYPKRGVIEIFYDDTRKSHLSFFIFAVIISFLIYELVQHVTLQDFFNSLPASDIFGILTISEKDNELPAISLFTKSPLLQIFLAGIGGFWLIILKRFWNLEWNKILKFEELDPHDKTLKIPEMKFRGSRSLVFFMYFAFFFYLSVIVPSIGSESAQEWNRSPMYYSLNNFIAFILPTTFSIWLFEMLFYYKLSKKQNRET